MYCYLEYDRPRLEKQKFLALGEAYRLREADESSVGRLFDLVRDGIPVVLGLGEMGVEFAGSEGECAGVDLQTELGRVG